EVESFLVHAAESVRLDPRPRDREAVGGQAEIGHDPYIVAIAVVVVDGDVGVLAAHHPARGLGERVPDRGAAAVGCDRAFDLIGRGGSAPGEAGREAELGTGLFLLSRHALTAPSIRPPTICRPNSTKTTKRGSTEAAVPVNSIT